MSDRVAELRAQAAHARTLVEAVYAPDLKASLLDAAAQLEAEADRLEGKEPTTLIKPEPE